MTQSRQAKYSKRKRRVSKTGTGKQYDEDFKKQAIKLAREVGNTAAAEELGIPKGTLGTWMHKARLGEIDTGSGTRDPGESLNLSGEDAILQGLTAIKLKEEDPLMIGYITRKGSISSRYGEMYISELMKYKEL